MGILDYLHPDDRDDLLELLRNATASGGDPSGTPPRSADLPSPLDSARWPVGPVGAPSHTDASMMSPAPFGFVPASLSDGVFNSTPAAPSAPPQASAASQARVAAGAGQSAPETDPWLAAANGWLDGIPVVGPYLISHGDRSMARARAERYGTSYDDELRSIQALTKRTAEDHPFVTGVAKWAGTLASLAPLGMTAAGAEALGLAGGPLIQMGARGALTSGLIGGADAAARNRSVLAGAGLAALGGAFGPVVGRVAGANAESLGTRAMQSPALADIATRIGGNMSRLRSALQDGTVRKSAGKLAGGLGLRRGLSDEQSLAPKQDDDQD